MIEDQNEAYEGFDSAIGEEADEGGFVLLPAGDYPFLVTKLDRVRYEGGDKIPACWKAELTLDVEGDGGTHAHVKENVYLTKKYAWKIKQLFVAVGQISPDVKEFTPDWNALVGDGGMLSLSQRSFKGRDGDDVKMNNVKKFLAPEEAAKAMMAAESKAAEVEPQPSFSFPRTDQAGA